MRNLLCLKILLLSTFIFISDILLSQDTGYSKPNSLKNIIDSSASDNRILKSAEIFLNEDKNEKKRRRAIYLESLHNHAEKDDWRQVDRLTRKRKAITKYKAISLFPTTTCGESVANGLISGIWEEKGSKNMAGRMTFCEYDTDNKMLYCSSAGGIIWKSDLNGTNWEPINDGIQLENPILVRLIPHEKGRRIIVVTAGWENYETVYSDDDGLTWQWAAGFESISGWGANYEAVITNDVDHTIYLSILNWDYQAWNAKSYLYVSTDMGESYHMIHDNPSITAEMTALWTDYFGSGKTYYLIDNVCYILSSSGNLTRLGSIPEDGYTKVNLTGRETATQTYLYAGFTDNQNTSIYQSVDGGYTWEYKGECPGGFFSSNSFECSAKNPEHLFIGGIEGYYSSNAGINWTRHNSWYMYNNNPEIYFHADLPSLNALIDENGEEFLAISTDAGVYISRNSMVTVKNISLSGLNVSQYYHIYTCEENNITLFAGSQDQGTQVSFTENDEIRDFVKIITGDNAQTVSSDKGHSVWNTSYAGILYLPNATTSKSYRWEGYDMLSGQEFLPPLMADPDDPTSVYMGGGSSNGDQDRIFKFTAGNRISYTELSYNFGSNISAMAYSNPNTKNRYLGTVNKLTTVYPRFKIQYWYFQILQVIIYT